MGIVKRPTTCRFLLYFQLITVLKIWRWRVQLFFVIINKKNND
uniref:Uncharacterized protein n=1 Tax=Siphoviridae sp. ctg4a4 TaxID=2825602 RepID=A0A8S5V5S6_9CAUD|nr:MAG TPA: hypothetical protein [Siphoviridae sp. ctg4a4]